MRFLKYLVFGTSAWMVGCGAEGGSSDVDPMPEPLAGDVCARQRLEQTDDGHDVVLCEQPYAEAPFVRLPETDGTRVFAALQEEGFVTLDGASHAYTASLAEADREATRHALALYELVLDGGRVASFRPVVLFEESLFLAPFAGGVFEGAISRRIGVEGYVDEASLPARLEIAAEPADGTGLKAVMTNLKAAVTASDGSCMPALSSYGDEAPFAAGTTVELRASRVPSMHLFGDDQFVFELLVDGVSVGSMMRSTWFRGPLDVLNGTLSPSGTYEGVGHGAPGAIPTLVLEPVDGGGEACAAP